MRDHDEGENVNSTGGFTMPRKSVPPRQLAPCGRVPAGSGAPSSRRRSIPGRFAVALAATMAMVVGLVGLAACSAVAAPSSVGGGVFTSSFLSGAAGLPAVKPALLPGSLPESFGEEGSGAGQLSEATGVAVNQASGNVYVMDRQNNRIDEFGAKGEFLLAWGWGVNPQEDSSPGTPAEALEVCTLATGCQAGLKGSGPGQLEEPQSLGGIAVNSTTGNVYVLESGRMIEYSESGVFVSEVPVSGGSVAVGPTGTVYVGEDGFVQEYTEKGKPGVRLPLEEAGGISGLVVNATGEIYIDEPEIVENHQSRPHPVRHYGPDGENLGEFDFEEGGSARSITLDSATGDVYILQLLATAGEGQQVRGFTPAGRQFTAFATTQGRVGEDFAFSALTGALYAPDPAGNGTGSTVKVLVPSEPGPGVSGVEVGGVEPTAVLVHATINPETGEASDEAHYRVEYASAQEYEATKTYGHSAPVGEGALPGSFEEDQVEVPLTGLQPRTLYHYRVVVSDECEKTLGVLSTCTTESKDQTFETQLPALIEEEFSSGVRSTSATLHATIDPEGFASTYHFVYGPCEGGGECSVPATEESIGSGKIGVTVEQHLNGLIPGQVYHYRVIARNEAGGQPQTVEGEQDSFTTQTGGEAGLPDDREWELASRPDKHGALLVGGGSENTIVRAAADGDGVAYPAGAPTESAPLGDGEKMQVLSRRSATGWSTEDLAIPHAHPSGVAGFNAYRLFSDDLAQDVLQPQGVFEPAMKVSTEATEQGPYLRNNDTGVFTPLVIGCKPDGECPADRDDTATPFVPFGEEEQGECQEVTCGPRVTGATPDLSHIVIESFAEHTVGNGKPPVPPPPLLENTPGNLYEWTAGSGGGAGKLSPISELPATHQPVETAAHLGSLESKGIMTHAISDDGSRVFFTNDTAGGTQPVLFLRDMSRKETIEIGGYYFEGANAEGTLVFYDGTECEIPEGKALECMPVEAEGGPVQNGNTLAFGENGQWVYFERAGSLYVREGHGNAKLIASHVGLLDGSISDRPQADPWRASPNGEWFAFMSNSQLTSYDNHDAATGRPDEEVYLYDAASERLVCASCDPTGARPVGESYVHMQLAGYDVTDGEISIAATIPGWSAYSEGLPVLDPRFLSDQGRLFFNSVGPLVAKDVNGQVDVYELEPAGVGSCTTGTQTGTVVYSPAADGCVGLISSGESPEESAFEEASETGEDVFFLSASVLSGSDLDHSLSMWDARVCGTSSSASCLPAAVSEPAACDNESSCKAPPTPQPGIYGPAASATFSGPGNVAPEASKPAVVVKKKTAKCPKGTIRDKKGRCVKKSKSKKAKKTSRNRRIK
jgi:hypothetical protein